MSEDSSEERLRTLREATRTKPLPSVPPATPRLVSSYSPSSSRVSDSATSPTSPVHTRSFSLLKKCPTGLSSLSALKRAHGNNLSPRGPLVTSSCSNVEIRSSAACVASTESIDDSTLAAASSSATASSSASVCTRSRSTSIDDIATLRADEEADAAVHASQQRQKYRQSLMWKGDAANKRISSRLPSKRRLVIIEFICTENSYVRDLKTLVEQFQSPVRERRLLDLRQQNTLFCNAEFVLATNEALLKDMEHLVMTTEDDEEICMGNTMLNHIREMFPVYAKYCMNHPASAQLYDELCKRKKTPFSLFLREAWGSISSYGLSLDSYLIKPIQRFMKYPLLLRELIEATSLSHPDYVSLKTALALTQDIIHKVNESKREEENINKLTLIETQIHGLNIKLVMRGRRFIRDGRLVKVAHGKHQERQFWVFNDVLLYAKPLKKADRYQFKGFVPLAHARLEVLTDTDSLKNAFSIERTDTTKKYLIYAKPPEQSSFWIKDLTQAIQELSGGPSGRNTVRCSANVAFSLSSGSTRSTEDALKFEDVCARVSGWKPERSDHVFIAECAGWEVLIGKEIRKDRYLFLFQDVLLITNKRNAKVYTLKHALPLCNYRLGEKIAFDAINLLPLEPPGSAAVVLRTDAKICDYWEGEITACLVALAMSSKER
mmetsp:Transcript_16155/g.48522  ORF Transcript_16155/g.48522 Transcript_16155/m.48522 type:complete len:663 (-) Transcript_16155:100-2088(-)|eukprot:CAMPEP_0174235852 /NCGR_PEP_ID=MMETSP0417-20130205/5168_1 /TAXON_ID=242541 /ORGANISM="Mayorella sp, Strain BSH-02190019" /LENGTH=662 /DNA_ID=CAMNT_0015314415 /DNA_START=92 /DNA_END=2080 /DNA_ORIENTATION=+